jgi:hypothetical protein
MNSEDKLSKHFTFGEMTATSQSSLLSKNRQEAQAFVDTAKKLCENILEPIREKFGPVIIHSGFRGPTLNARVGGTSTSQHTKFEAADFHCVNATLEDVFDWIRKESDIKFGQLILEGHSAGRPTWIHISLGSPWRSAERSGQVLIFDGKNYNKVK